MSFWKTAIQWAFADEARLEQGALLLQAGAKAYADVKSGKHNSALESIKANFPKALPVIEDIANLLIPGAGTAIEVVSYLLAFSHEMTPEEEARWMDNAKGDIGAI